VESYDQFFVTTMRIATYLNKIIQQTTKNSKIEIVMLKGDCVKTGYASLENHAI
jgi:hypothetical protein